MAKVEVIINGVTYPCRPTMGAMLRFKHETGKEVTEIDERSLSELCTYLYCCVVSACAADKVGFDMPLMDFADAITPEDLNAWAESVKDANGKKGKGEKKR